MKYFYMHLFQESVVREGCTSQHVETNIQCPRFKPMNLIVFKEPKYIVWQGLKV